MYKIKFLCALLVVFLLVPAHLPAADQENEEPIQLQEVVVTATRTEQAARKVPANISVITREDIERSNAQSMADVLRREAGVWVRDLLGNGKTAQVDLRGFGETGPYNTLVLIDGRRVNDIDLSGTDWTQIPLEQVQRIEILRGSGSVLYGDSAVGGVVNIITRTPSEKIHASAGVKMGSYGRSKGEVSLSGGIRNWYGAVYGIYEDTGGYRVNNTYRGKDVGGKIVYDATDALSLKFSGSYHEDRYDMPGPMTETQMARSRKSNFNPYDKSETRDGYAMLGLDLDLLTYGRITMDVSHRDRWTRADFPDLTGVFPQLREIESETWMINPRYVFNRDLLGRENKLIAGVDFSKTDYRIDSFGGFFIPTSTPTGISDDQRTSLGWYIHDELSFTDHLIFTVGARTERVHYDLDVQDLNPFPLAPLDTRVSDREEAWEAGLTFLYGENSSAFFRVNRSFRFPLLDEVVYQDWTTFRILANTDLAAQTGLHLETGLRHFFSPGLQASVTLFQADMENEIFYNPLTFSNENHSGTLHRGIELGARANIFKKWTIYGNYTYESAKLNKNPYDGNRIPGVPEHKANIGVQARNLIPRLTWTLDYNYVGASYVISDFANNFKKLDDHYTIDVKVSYRYENWEAFAGVNNLTDQEYSDYAVMDTFLTQRNFYPAPERNWIAGVKFTY